LKTININIYGFVKNIFIDKNRKLVNITLENLFDLNNIILEVPRNHKILQNLYINCIYVFFNLNLFIDENLNIKLTVQSDKIEKSRKILLYYLIDPIKYNNKKIHDFLIKKEFSQLLPLVKQNILIRTFQKYLIIIHKIYFINLIFNEIKEIINYEGYFLGSDGTSQAIFYIKGNNNISELLLFNIDIKYYLNKKSNLKKKFITIKPNIKTIQLIIIVKKQILPIKSISIIIFVIWLSFWTICSLIILILVIISKVISI
jgi:hypothetical protein